MQLKRACGSPAGLLHKHEHNSQNDEQETNRVVPLKMLALKHEGDNDRKDYQRDNLLNDLQLEEREGSSVYVRPDTIGRHQEAVFKECYSPRGNDDKEKRPFGCDVHLLKFKVSVPSKRHEDVG